MAMNGSQRKLGYADVVYNIKTGKFYAPVRGDNYYELDVQTGGGDGGDGITTATLPLDNPSREARADSTGLKTQKDFNIYIDAAVKEVEAEAGNHFSGDYNDLTNQPTIPTDNADLTNGAGYITLDEVPDPVLEGALVFKGNAANEGALPGDAAVGDIYFNEEDSHMYAWGADSQWHKLNTIDDVDLSGYARLSGANFKGAVELTFDGDDPRSHYTRLTYSTVFVNARDFGFATLNSEGLYLVDNVNSEGIAVKPSEITAENATVTAKEFIGDGSKLTNLPDSGVDWSQPIDASPAFRGNKISVGENFNLRAEVTPQGLDALDTSKGQVWLTPIGMGVINYENGKALSFDTTQEIVEAEDFVIKAKEFIGDGSKLTNLPSSGGGAVGISEVLAEGDTAAPGQNLTFELNGDRIPFISNSRESIENEGGLGFRLGALVSYMYANEPFTIETEGEDAGVSEFDWASRRMSVADDYYYSSNDKGDVWYGAGLTGISYRDGDSHFKIFSNDWSWWFRDPDNIDNYWFRLDISAWSGDAKFFCKTIEANEFIGDGSKLTGLPTPDMDEYARLDGADFTGDVNGVNFYADQVRTGTNTISSGGINVGTGDIRAATSQVIAAEFIGDGSKLTGVGLPDFRTLTPLS